MPSSVYRASAALIAILALAACSGGTLPIEPQSSDPVEAAFAAAPATDVASLVGNSWATGAAMPTARAGLAAATVNDVVYAIGGEDAIHAPLAAVESYNPKAIFLPWKAKAPLPEARKAPNAASVINGKIYVSGGINVEGKTTRTLFVYNPATDTWSRKARMPVASHHGGTGVIAGKLYLVATPGLADAARSRLFRYDPGSNTWTERTPPPDNHFGSAVGVINGKLYVAGGISPQKLVMGKLSVYDPATDSWTSRAAMLSPRLYSAARVIGGKLYVAGGMPNNYGAETEVYDPQANTWTARADMPTARYLAAGTVANGLFHVLGGTSGTSLAIKTNEVYTP